MDKDELLAKIKELLRPELSTISFNTFIETLGIRSINGNNIVFTVVFDGQYDYIENKYRPLILNTLKYITNKEWNYTVVDISKNNNLIDDIKDEEPKETVRHSNPTIDPKYTFENFIVGNYNRLAHAAALYVGNNPGQEYNPLYFYGGVGLGKTHLMHAIGNRIIEDRPDLKVMYVTSEKFTNQLINAIQENKTEIFRNKYRNIDVLLIDDIQFIAGKKQVQEEFFHTFNALTGDGKQIVLSGDEPPKNIEYLQERLISRFSDGIMADFSETDYETRLAILKKKAHDEGIIVDDFILSNIANKIDTNIRELKGVFKKISLMASLNNSPITIELAEKTINEFIQEREKVISSDFIKETVSKYFGINKEDMDSSKRSKDIAVPRQIAMYLCREIAGMSYTQIGNDFGKRDHSTVMHGCNKIANEVKENKNTKVIVESVQNLITNDKKL